MWGTSTSQTDLDEEPASSVDPAWVARPSLSRV